MPHTLADVSPLDLVGVPEIAEMLGVSRQYAYRLIARDDFPEPDGETSAGRVWLRMRVEKWKSQQDSKGEGRL